MRPSVYPERVVYHDDPRVVAEVKALEERERITFAEAMRRTVRAGLREMQEAA